MSLEVKDFQELAVKSGRRGAAVALIVVVAFICVTVGLVAPALRSSSHLHPTVCRFQRACVRRSPAPAAFNLPASSPYYVELDVSFVVDGRDYAGVAADDGFATSADVREERAAAEARHRVIWWETTQIGWQVNKAGQRFVPSERCYYDINTFQGEAPLVLLSLPTSLGVYLLWAALGVPLLCACFCCVSRPLVAACSGGGDDAVDHCNASLWLIFLIPLGFFMPLWLWANLDDQDRAGVLVFGLLTLGGGIASYVTWSCSGQGTDDGGSPPAARGSDRHDSHTDSDDSETRADECRCGRPVAVLASCGHWFCAACVTRFGNRCGECGARFGFLVDSRGMVIASAPSRRRLDGAGRRPPFPPPSTETLADAVSARLQARRARSEAAAKPTPPQRRTSRSAKDAPRAGAAKEDNSCGVGRRRTLPGQSSAKRERVSRLEEIVRKESERLESKAAAAARRDAPTEDDPCCICLDAPRDMVLSCGHRLCLTCGDEENGLTQCPLCRADIEWRFAARSDEEMG